MIFLDWFQTLKSEACLKKQNETFAKMKRGSVHQEFCKKNREEQIHKNDGIVVDAKLAEDGTVRLYLNNERYPVRIYPDGNSVLIVSAIKRLFPLLLKNIKKQNIFSKITTLLAINNNANIILDWFENLFYLYDILLKEEHWSQPIKEVRRVLKDKVDARAIDAVSLVLEFDSAYRFIFQDVMAEMDRTNLELQPIKEIKRLFDILISRANGGDVQKFKNIKWLASIYLLFNRKLLKTIKQIAKDLKLDEIKPTQEDVYWMYYLRTYNCFGLPEQQRLARYNMIKAGGTVEDLLNKSVGK